MKIHTVLSALLLTTALSVSAHASNKCTIQSFDGHYLTAVGGGGQLVEPIHTDASRIGAWETFTLRKYANGNPSGLDYAIATSRGYLITAVGGGGRTTDVLHTDGNKASTWERFTLVPQGVNYIFAIKTKSGNYLTAQDSGGRITDVIHSNATKVGTWEKFRIVCGN